MPNDLNSAISDLRQDPSWPPEWQRQRAARQRLSEGARRLWRRRRLVFRFTLAGLLTSGLLLLLLPRRFQAMVQIMPPETPSAGRAALLSSMAGGINGSLDYDLLGGRSSSALMAGILASPAIQDELIDAYDLRRVYRCRSYLEAEKVLAGRSRIAEERRSGMVSVRVSDSDPRRAAALAKAYVEKLNTLLSRASTSAARRQRIFLEQRLGTAKQDLSVTEKQLAEFSSRQGTIDVADQARAMVEAAARLQGEVIAAEAELSGMRQMYAEGNVRVLSLKARVAELRQQLQMVSGTAGTRPGAVLPDSDPPLPSLRKLPLLGTTYLDLRREMRVQEVVYETLTREYELAKVEEAREIPTVRMLREPRIPERPSFPPSLLLLGGGAVLACLAGIVCACTADAWSEAAADEPCKQLLQEMVDDARGFGAAFLRRKNSSV